MSSDIVRYGMGYQGSKNSIAWNIVNCLPSNDTLVDLFCGGGAITHCALAPHKPFQNGHGRFKNFIMNDVNSLIIKGVQMAFNGEYKNEKRWISGEEFHKLKTTDPYVAVCWSFGNNLANYMCCEEVADWKRALWYARVYNDFTLLEDMDIHLPDASRKTIKANEKEIKEKYIKWWLHNNKYRYTQELADLIKETKDKADKNKEELRLWLCDALKDAKLTQAEVGKRLGTQKEGHYFERSQWEFPTKKHYNKMREFIPKLDKEYEDITALQRLNMSLQRLERLQSLECLESLQCLERLQSLECLESNISYYSTDYREVPIPPNSTVYCDIPYANTERYRAVEGFNHKEFYEWALSREFPVFVSEYNMPDDFTCIYREKKCRMFSRKEIKGKVDEGLFVQNKFAKEYLNPHKYEKVSLFDDIENN